MNISFVGKLVEEPSFKTVGKNKTALAKLKVAEDVRTKNRETGKYEVTGKNFYEVQCWGDTALDAQMLQVGDVLDFRHYQNEGEDFVRFRAKIDEETWEYKGKQYSKLQITAYDFDKIEKGD